MFIHCSVSRTLNLCEQLRPRLPPLLLLLSPSLPDALWTRFNSRIFIYIYINVLDVDGSCAMAIERRPNGMVEEKRTKIT